MPRLLLNTCLLMMSALVLNGCAKAGLFLANLPASFSKAQLHADIAYGDSPDQKLDLYLPKKVENPPVIIFFYGGRWTDGKKEQYRFAAETFTKEGYAVAVPDYRKYPNVKFPAFAEDIAAATAWIYNNDVQYGYNSRMLFLAGHSSGAHTAALVATDKQYLEEHGLTRDIISGFAGLSGPYAFIPEDKDLKDMFGPPERYPLMRAPNFVDGKQPPMLLIHGLEDEIVVLENAEKLEQEIKKKGGQVELVTYKNLDHIETIGSLAWFWSYKSDIKDKLLNFFKENQ